MDCVFCTPSCISKIKVKLSLCNECKNVKQTTRSCLSIQAIFNGIESVRAIVREEGIQGFYGPLIENFTCDKKFYTAVEVTAGNK